jgi:hypothetical protein
MRADRRVGQRGPGLLRGRGVAALAAAATGPGRQRLLGAGHRPLPGARLGGDRRGRGQPRHPRAELAVARLGLLPQRQEGGGDEDRRVGPGGDADEQGQREVLDGLRAQQEGTDEQQRADRHQRGQ